MSYFEVLDKNRHRVGSVRVERRAVVKDYGAAGGEGGDQPVPHHPAVYVCISEKKGYVMEENKRGCGEVEHPISRTDIAVENMFFFMLN